MAEQADEYTITNLHSIEGKYFFTAMRLLPNGNASSTTSFYPIANMSSDEDILSGYDAAIARWHEIEVTEEQPFDQRALITSLSQALGAHVTIPIYDRSYNVTITHEVTDHVIRITAVRRDKRGREAEQWKDRVPENDRAALAAAIRKGAAYAQTLKGESFN